MNSFTAIPEHLTAKIYVYQTVSEGVDESSLLRLDPDETLRLYEQGSIVLDSTLATPRTILETPTKNYVDSLYVKSRNRRHLSTVFNDQDDEMDNN